MKAIEVGNVRLELWDHRKIDQIEDEFQAVIDTEIYSEETGDEPELAIHDCYNEKSEHKTSAFYHDNSIGCRGIEIKEVES